MAKKKGNNLLMLGALAAGAIYLATKNDAPKVGAIGERVPLVPNRHVIIAKYVGQSNSKDPRVKLTSARFGNSKFIDFDYDHGNTYDTAIAYLLRKGFNVIGKAEGKDCYYIISDTFEPLS